MATNPTKKPTSKMKVSGLKKPARVGATNAITTKFKVPANDMKKDNASKATNVDVWWTVSLVGGGTLVSKREHGAKVTESTLNINNFTAGKSTYTRDSFYPSTNRRIKSVKVQVREKNRHGAGPWLDKSTNDFEVPKRPSISALTLNPANGRVTFTITTDDTAGLHERNRTCYQVKLYSSVTNKEVPTTRDPRTSTNVQISGYYDVADWQAIRVGDYLRITVEAWNQGWRGDSEHVKRSITLAYPTKATIGTIDCAGTSEDSKVTVYVSAGDSKARETHPVTLCRLEVLANSEYQEASDIPASADWEPIGATDDGNVKAFASKVGLLRPEQGNKTWLRVVTVNLVEEPYSIISEYKSVTKLEVKRPTAEDDSVAILSAVPSADGRSADVTIAWDEDTPNTGTELTWSQDDNAWESTNLPQPFEFEWSNLTPPEDYSGAALIHLMGLTEGAVTFVRARRYFEDANGNRTWTGYSNMEQVMPVTAPNSVSLSVPPFVPRGSDIEAVWTYDTDAPQTSWQLFQMLGETPDVATDRVLDGGEDARGSYVLSADAIDSDELSLYVSMSTGGSSKESDPVTVSVVDPPECMVQASTLMAKPMTISVTSNVQASEVMAIVTAGGTSGDGFGMEQLDGDTVWSDVVISPPWTQDGTAYTTEITIPDDALFYDNADYHVEARVMDGATGLTSETAEADFTVDWSRKAPPLVDDDGYKADVRIKPYDVTDQSGFRTRACQIVLSEPDDADPSDVYDVYRVSREGASLVAEGVDLDAVVIDPYAPFGGTSLAYRLVCRTTNGSTEWADFPYDFATQGPTDNYEMRIDFGTEYVECERAVAPSDRWKKSFTITDGIDGSVTGTWGNVVRRESNTQAAFVRVYEDAQQLSMESLATYQGPCFVRMSDGSAYEANVEVTGKSTSVTSAGVVYSLSMTQIDLTGDYLAEVTE